MILFLYNSILYNNGKSDFSRLSIDYIAFPSFFRSYVEFAFIVVSFGNLKTGNFFTHVDYIYKY